MGSRSRPVQCIDSETGRIECLTCTEYTISDTKHIPKSTKENCKGYSIPIVWSSVASTQAYIMSESEAGDDYSDWSSEQTTTTAEQTTTHLCKYIAKWQVSVYNRDCETKPANRQLTTTRPCSKPPSPFTKTLYGGFESQAECWESKCCNSWNVLGDGIDPQITIFGCKE